MRIQFVLESLGLTGGSRVVYEHALRLRRMGHEVRVLVPALRVPWRERSLIAWKHYAYERWSGRVQDGVRAYALADAVVHFDPEHPERVPDADATIATAWRTAEWVAAMPPSTGTLYYLIQQYEAWTEDLRKRVDATWRLPLRRIVIAGWLERLGRERFGEAVWARIPNGVDSARFSPGDRRYASPARIGLLYDAAPWKGAKDGVEALWRLHRADPTLPLGLLGRPRLRHALPPGTRYVRDPMQAELAEAYRSFDVFLNASHSEGFSLVTLEAMACGCALVATDVGEVPEMGAPGTEYVMVPAKDPDALADAALSLARDPARLRAMAESGLAMARRYTWDEATRRFSAAIGAGPA